MNCIIEVSDIDLSEKVNMGNEYYNSIKDNTEYIKSIEFIKFKVEELLDEKDRN